MGNETKSQRHKGQVPKAKAHEDQIVKVEAQGSAQSDIDVTKALRVKAFRFVICRLLFFLICRRARQVIAVANLGDSIRTIQVVGCTTGSLEKFLRLTQKIPISLSVEEHRDATNLE